MGQLMDNGGNKEGSVVELCKLVREEEAGGKATGFVGALSNAEGDGGLAEPGPLFQPENLPILRIRSPFGDLLE